MSIKLYYKDGWNLSGIKMVFPLGTTMLELGIIAHQNWHFQTALLYRAC